MLQLEILTKNGNGHHPNGNGHKNSTPVQILPSTVPDKLQPHNVEAEEAVLGSLLIDPDSIIRISTFLESTDFYVERNGWIYDVIQTLHCRQDSTPANLITVSDELTRRGQLNEAGGEVYLSELINATPTSIHIEYYARIVERTAFLRHLIEGAGQIARLAYQDTEEVEDVRNRAEEIIFNICSRNNHSDGPQHIRAGVERHNSKIEFLYQNPGTMTGIPTGLKDLDRLLGGLQKTDMILLAGRPGSGKTSLALNIGLYAAKVYKKRIGLFSLEMNEGQLIQRLIAAEAGIDSQHLNRGQIKEDEWSAWLQAQEILSSVQIFIDDTPALSANQLRSKARKLQMEHGLDLIIVDYLQLMNGDRKSENRQQEITYISRSIKALARELKIPVLALSQLSRQCESRQDKRPILSDLRESGSLEQDSDVVLFLYRDDMYNPDTEFPNVTEVIVGKHRQGPTGVFSVYFKKHLTQFVDLEINKSPDYNYPQMYDGKNWVMED